MIDLKRIIKILRDVDKRVLQADVPNNLCELLVAALAFWQVKNTRQTTPGINHLDRLEQPLPESFTNRNQMWAHFKTCDKCLGQIRPLFRSKRILNIIISSHTSPGSMRGKLMVEIDVVPFTVPQEDIIEVP